jgi:glycogen(starch) synthase
MALEAPIVTSSLPTLLETVDASTAELARPGDASELAGGILRVLADPAAAAGRARAGRARFEADFTVEASARRMAALYDRVATLDDRVATAERSLRASRRVRP